jgi:hypothetical protein
MKFQLIFFLISLTLSYDPDAAANYAMEYCANYNPYYPNYADLGGDCANFVSQAMIAGGFSFDDCYVTWLDEYGCCPRVEDIMSCLDQKGWKQYWSVPPNFRRGYPLFLTDHSHAMIACDYDGNDVYFCGHTYDVCGYPVYFDAIYYTPG